MMMQGIKSISLSELFHENTKIPTFVYSTQRVSSSSTEDDLDVMLDDPEKEFPLGIEVSLPENGDVKASFSGAIRKRRSLRKFTGRSLSLGEISSLLQLSYGATHVLAVNSEKDKRVYSLHAVPSAGALYPIEIYIAAFNIARLADGLYYYSKSRHLLRLVKKGDFRDQLYQWCFKQEALVDSNLILLLNARFFRTKTKYGERGYRYVLLDAGHLGQNIYLAAAALNLGVVGICGFQDDEINRFLGLDGVNESVIYSLIVGRPG